MVCTKRRTLYVSIMMVMAANVHAQSKSTSESNAHVGDLLEEIVVTGTLIRGMAPTGSNVVSMDEADIVVSGAATANDVLATIPQVSSNFNNIRSLPPGAAVNLAPSLRNFGASAAPTTLVMMDGHRMVNAGVLSTSPDPDVIPPGVLGRVEVVTDGGSSIYGSDAVGGVINFITRDEFEGVEVSARYGLADDYGSSDFNITAGHNWGSGIGYISYSYAGNDEVLGKDRDFMRQVAPNTGECGPGTVFSGSNPSTLTPYALPGRVAGTMTNCDNTDDKTFFPEVERHSVYGRLTQDLTESITFGLSAIYTKRESISHSDPESTESDGGGKSAVICAPDISAETCAGLGGVVYSGYIPVGPDDSGLQQVKFNYAGLMDNEQSNELELFQVTPSFTFDLMGEWQLKALASYGKSTTDSYYQQIDASKQPALIAAGVLNPYSPRSASRSDLESLFVDSIGDGTQELVNARVVADGGVFEISGGSVGLAVGVEYTKESLKDVVYGDFPSVTGAAGVDSIDADRDIESAFFEVIVPLVSAQNSVWGVNELSVSLSARHDSYSDFGSTTNPKVGLTYSPIDAVTFRGSWGTSFVAPSLADTHAPDTRSTSLPAYAAFDPSAPPASPTQMLIALIGGNPDLQPQEAEIWSFGADVDVTYIPGLSLSATYYDIHFEDQIAVNSEFYTSVSQEFWTLNPSQEEAEAAVAGTQPYLGIDIATLYTPGFGNGVYSILDFRRNNLAEVKQNGVDFNLSYITDTKYGRLLADLSGTYTLKREVMSGPGKGFVDVLKEPGDSDLAYALSLGWQAGDFSAKATWNHTEGYGLEPSVSTVRFGNQKSVESFDTVDLFFQYDFQSSGLLENTSLTLNLNNVVDEEPPFYSGTTLGALPGYTNGSTLGRQALLGFRKKF